MIEIYEKIRNFLIRIIRKVDWSTEAGFHFLAAVTGLGAGYIAIIFHRGIHYFKEFAYGMAEKLPESDYIIILIPAIGGLIVGLIAYFYSSEAKGHGVPPVMKAVVINNGIIKPNIVLAKTVSSIASIGSGGACGREGPIVQIGAAFGSFIGQFFRLSPQRIRTLVGCGAAGGIAGIFNAPLGGVMFAIEIILGEFNVKTFSPIVISAVIATAISRSVLGDNPTFVNPNYSLISNYELGFYLLLGIICGIVSVGYIKIFYWFEDLFNKLKGLHPVIKPAFGGLLVGIIGTAAPGIFGFSYDIINDAILSKVDLTVLIVTLILNPIAFGITLGSGGSGGIFAPTLKTGAMLGGIIGYFFHLMFPKITADFGAYALVGMGALVAGALHAPITIILMLFEITGEYKIILPIMFAAVSATTISKVMMKDSIYTLALSRAGINIAHGVNLNVVTNVRIKDIMRSEFNYVTPATTFGKVINSLLRSNTDSIIVVEPSYKMKLVGIINFNDIKEVIADQELYHILVAEDLAQNPSIILTENDNLGKALRAFEIVDYDIIPVVSSKDRSQIIGVIHRDDVFDRYHKEILIQQLEEQV